MLVGKTTEKEKREIYMKEKILVEKYYFAETDISYFSSISLSIFKI